MVLFRLQRQSTAGLQPCFQPFWTLPWLGGTLSDCLLWVQDLEHSRYKESGEGLANQAPGLATFQVLHDKTTALTWNQACNLVTRWWWYQFASVLGLSVQFSLVPQSCPTLCDPHGLQQARPPCSSPTPRVYPNSCPFSRWCHPTISSSVIPFSSWLQYFPASGTFQMNQLFASGGQSIGV